jgi:hypothetical protein
VLDKADRDAIRHYRTSFTSTYDTKNPAYSVPSVIFKISLSSLLVTHMVLAIGAHQSRSLLKGGLDRKCQQSSKAQYHYGRAIKLLGDQVVGTLCSSQLDAILAALWLLLVYEQRFGDSNETISNHLHGIGAILTANVQRSSAFLPAQEGSGGVCSLELVHDKQEISYISYRLIVWLTSIDAQAASFGLGGHLNELLACRFGLGNPSKAEPSWSAFHSDIYERSAPLFEHVWGVDYPTSERQFDAINQALCQLFRETSLLRLSVARVMHAAPEQLTGFTASIEKEIEALEERYADLLSMASAIPTIPEESRPLLAGICWIVSHYYASILDFYQSIDPEGAPSHRRSTAFRSIVRLAYYGFEMEGDVAIFRVAWPLLKAGMETDDPIHRQWILERFRQIEAFGENFKLAFEILQGGVHTEQPSRNARAQRPVSACRATMFFI